MKGLERIVRMLPSLGWIRPLSVPAEDGSQIRLEPKDEKEVESIFKHHFGRVGGYKAAGLFLGGAAGFILIAAVDYKYNLSDFITIPCTMGYVAGISYLLKRTFENAINKSGEKMLHYLNNSSNRQKYLPFIQRVAKHIPPQPNVLTTMQPSS